MNAYKLMPVLYTREMQKTVDFYVGVLGFECVSSELNWSMLQLDHVEIMIALPNEHIPFDKPNFTGSFYIKTNEVDRLWQIFKELTRVCYGIENFEYGMREFAIYDNNGYLLQFGQEISQKYD